MEEPVGVFPILIPDIFQRALICAIE